MKSTITLLTAAAFVAIGLGAATVAHAEGPPVTMVFIVDVEPANTAAYMKALGEAQGIIKGLGMPGFRVLQATAAGDAVGNLAILVDADDLNTWAANTTKLQADEGWQAWVAKQQQAGLANILSQNLWVERMAR